MVDFYCPYGTLLVYRSSIQQLLMFFLYFVTSFYSLVTIFGLILLWSSFSSLCCSKFSLILHDFMYNIMSLSYSLGSHSYPVCLWCLWYGNFILVGFLILQLLIPWLGCNQVSDLPYFISIQFTISVLRAWQVLGLMS